MTVSLELVAGVAAAIVLQFVVMALTAVWRTSRHAAPRHRLSLLVFIVSVALPIAAPLSPAPLRWSVELPMAGGLIGRDVVTPLPGSPVGPEAGQNGRAPRAAQAGIDPPLAVASHPRSLQAGGIALIIYLIGLLVATLRYARGVVRLQKLRSSASVDRPVEERASELAAALELGPKNFTVLTSDRVASPLTFGLLRPTIVLPEAARRFGPDQMDTVLLHELAHVRRRDHVSIWLLSLGTALFWFSPFAWLVATRARADAEIATDAMAIGVGRLNARIYGRALLEITRMLRPVPRVAAAIGVTGSELSKRIEAICAARPPLVRVSAWFTAIAAASLFSSGLLLASPQFSKAVYTDPSASELIETEQPEGVPPSDERVILGIVETLRTDPDPGVRRSAVEELGQSPYVEAPEVQAALLASLSDPSEQVRRSARIALGLEPDAPNKVFEGFGSRAAETPLDLAEVRKRMGDRRAAVRLETVRLLDGTTDPRAIDLLEAALIRDESDVVRSEAAPILGRVGDRDSVMVLIRALEDSSWRVRQYAAGALGDRRDARATLALAAALRDPNDHVRQWAAGSLGDIGDVAAVAHLIAATRDSNVHVRQTAVDALGDIGDSTAVPALLDAMHDDHPDVRGAAINSLGEIRGARSR